MGVCAEPPATATQAAAPSYGDEAQRLFVQPRFALFGQPFELFILLMDAIGDARLVSFTRRTGCLFYQLPDIALKDRDPIVELGQ
jgi:hypothetical protein